MGDGLRSQVCEKVVIIPANAAALYAITRGEMLMLRVMDFPFGSSILGTVEKRPA